MKMETPFFCEKYMHRQGVFVSIGVYLWFRKFSKKDVDTLLRVLIKTCFFSRLSSGYGVAGGTTE
jgi:hypothetical protein